MKSKYKLLSEGKVRFWGPDLELYRTPSGVEPSWAPVFYNPAMKLNRDISVAALQAYCDLYRRGVAVCEPLSATGVRGLRYAAGVDGVDTVYLNDLNEEAYRLIKLNVEANGLEGRARVFKLDANVLLAIHARGGTRFDVVDIDPFGSPVPFLDNAIRALKHGGMLCATATDLAPLFGVHKRACIRKYGAIPLRVRFSREIGTRILLGYIARTAAKYSIGVLPLLSFYARHYIRAAVLVLKGRKHADLSIDKLGYVFYCRKCGYRRLVEFSEVLSAELNCESCGARVEVAGPLWIGEIAEREFAERAYEAYKRLGYLDPRGERILELVVQECGKPPLYYSTEEIAVLYRVEEPPVRELVDVLARLGYDCSLTHFDPKGFRADATAREIAKIAEGLRRL